MLIEKPRCNFNNCRYCFDGNCRSADKYENCKLTDLHYQIAKLTVDLDNAKTEWISVEERLPQTRERVLCYSPKKKSGPIFVGWRGHCNDWYQEPCYCCMDKITHWMPLPEAPKMRKEDEGK